MPAPPWGSSQIPSIQGLSSDPSTPASMSGAIVDPSTWPKRYGLEGTPDENKGEGYLGLLQRPDNPSTVMSEYSIGTNVNGQQMEIPSIVPTLSKDEVSSILNSPDGTPPPQSVVQKATDFARQRLSQGKSVWAQHGEQNYDLYPDLPRAQMKMPQAMSRTGQPTNPNALVNALQGLQNR